MSQFHLSTSTACPSCGTIGWHVLTSCSDCGQTACDRCPGARCIDNIRGEMLCATDSRRCLECDEIRIVDSRIAARPTTRFCSDECAYLSSERERRRACARHGEAA
jgi:hypothetical protein